MVGTQPSAGADTATAAALTDLVLIPTPRRRDCRRVEARTADTDFSAVGTDNLGCLSDLTTRKRIKDGRRVSMHDLLIEGARHILGSMGLSFHGSMV